MEVSEMTTIEPGALVLVRTADGKELQRRAVTGVEDGLDFPVVWVATEDEWSASNGNGHRPEALPWPSEDVELVEA
jgi:hypothetical protein